MNRILLPLVLVFAVISLGATCVKPHDPVKPVVIDCTLENQDRITALISEFYPLINGDAPDWGSVYQRAKQAGRAIGGCALAQLVQNYLTNKAAPPAQADSWTAYSTLEQFRREEANDATFRTAQGDL